MSLKIKTILLLFLSSIVSFQATKAQGVPDSIKIDSGNYFINLIIIQGNKVTKPHIIQREIIIREGARYDSGELQSKLKQSRLNLLNTALFNFVNVEPIKVGKDSLNIRFIFTERFYTWPFPIFELADRNFNAWWLNKDWSRTNYGFYIVRENFRGRKETLKLKFRFGFSQQFGIAYNVPFINKKQTIGFGTGVTYSANNEIIFSTINDKTIFFKNVKEKVRRELGANISFNGRKGIFYSQSLQIKYNNIWIDDTLAKLNPDYLLNRRNFLEFFSVSAIIRDDHRNIKAYPLTGHYMDLEINKIGLGILSGEKVDLINLQGTARKFWKLYPRIYSSAGLKIKISGTAKQPYYIQRGLGYSDYVRGYEYYVIDGQNFYLIKSAIKYELIKPRTEKIAFLKSTKFNTFHYAVYTGIFFDGGYVRNRFPQINNKLSNQFLPGYGVSLDYVTYYDAVLRIEYSFNKMGESGFYFHMLAPF